MLDHPHGTLLVAQLLQSPNDDVREWEVLNYEVPLMMSPDIQATGQRFVHNWVWLLLAERAR